MSNERSRPGLRQGAFAWISFVGCILLAWLLRLYRLDAQSLWYDEAVSALLATRSPWDMVRWTAGDIQPPLYYLLLHGWQQMLGTSEWALRSLSAWWSTLAVGLAIALGTRITRQWWVGALAGLFIAVAPWAVYYAQEARMYSQLVALALLWVYLVLRLPSRPAWPHALGLAVTGLGLLYTHYFALFFVATWAAWHLLFRGTRHSLNLRFWAIAFGLMGVGYAPWLPFMWRRFQEDASYWSGRLKLAEAIRHWLVHMTLGAPETFLEADAIRWLPAFAALTLIALGGLGWALRRDRRGRRVGLGLVAWLVVPALAIFVVAYRTPKFNPRYVMLVYPAWIFLVAWGIAGLPKLTRAIPIAFLVGAFLWADWNWFTNPAFTKPDFRGAIAYIKAHRQPRDAVILVSGHMSPVVDYYAQGWSYLRLPDIDVLDVRQVLGFEVASTLNAALAGADHAWLLLWQDEVVDPMGVVPYLLSFAGEETSLSRNFWHVRVRHFRLITGQVPDSPPVDHALGITWEKRVTLVGLSQEENGQLRLFFRAEQPLDEDYWVHMELLDGDGNLWGTWDGRPGPYLYPTFRWQPGRLVMGLHELPAVPGTPAGTYRLRLRMYSSKKPNGLEILDAMGAPQGRDVIVPDIQVPETRPAPLEAPWPPLQTPVEEVSLAVGGEGPIVPVALRWTPAPPWEPGQRVITQVRWHSRRAPRRTDVAHLIVVWGNRESTVATFPLSEIERGNASWPANAAFFSQVRWRVPRDAAPGPAYLALAVTADGEARQYSLPISIKPSSRVFVAPPVQYLVNATFGDVIRLVGIDVAAETETEIVVTLTWQALQEVDRPYTAFVHLLGPDGRLVSQDDHVPRPYPPDAWIAGEVVQDTFRLSVPDEQVGKPLLLETGFYDAQAPGMPRLPVTEGPGDTAVRVEVAWP